MDEEKSKSITQQVQDGELSISIKPPDDYIKSLVFQAMIPMQKKYMKAALISFCKSCEHCEYCAVKTLSQKCKRFHSFSESYLLQIQDEIL